MNGIDYLIDTNILLYILRGNPKLRYLAQAELLAVSCVTEMEILGKFQIEETEKNIIAELLQQSAVIDITHTIKQITIQLKQKYRLKLPDAIIAATAIQQNLALITADKGFAKIEELDLILINIENADSTSKSNFLIE